MILSAVPNSEETRSSLTSLSIMLQSPLPLLEHEYVTVKVDRHEPEFSAEAGSLFVTAFSIPSKFSLPSQ
jgi:hypothetical protein